MVLRLLSNIPMICTPLIATKIKWKTVRLNNWNNSIIQNVEYELRVKRSVVCLELTLFTNAVERYTRAAMVIAHVIPASIEYYSIFIVLFSECTATWISVG